MTFYYQDVFKINEGKPPLYQDSSNKAIENSWYLLNGLDEDAAVAKRLKHPQAEMIEHEWVDALKTHWSELYVLYVTVKDQRLWLILTSQ